MKVKVPTLNSPTAAETICRPVASSTALCVFISKDMNHRRAGETGGGHTDRMASQASCYSRGPTYVKQKGIKVSL